MWRMFKKYLPKRDSLQQEGVFHWLGEHLHHPELWQFYRHNVAKGVAFGLLTAFIPLPGQTLVAALLAYIARANLPIAIVMTWISNPLTFVPINYGIYKVGQWLTGDATPYHPLSEFYWQGASLSETGLHLWQWLNSLGKPFLVGSMAVSVVSAMAGYFLVQIVWQLVKLIRSTQH